MTDADGEHLTLQLQRDAPLGSDLPAFATNSTTYNASIPLQNQTIFWNPLPDASEGWDGFALLVDDVERYVGAALNFSLASLQAGIPHFFRLAVSGPRRRDMRCVFSTDTLAGLFFLGSIPATRSLATSPCQRLCGQTAHGSIRCLDHLDHLNSLRLEH